MSEIHQEMLTKVGSSWEAFQEALGRVPPHRLEEAGVVETWSVKDLMGHVTSWERRAMSTIRAYQESGGLSAMEWPDVDDFNAATSESNRTRSLGDLRSDMEKVHDELLSFIEGLPREDAQEPKVQRRVRVDGYEHYAEHTKHILEWLEKGCAI